MNKRTELGFFLIAAASTVVILLAVSTLHKKPAPAQTPFQIFQAREEKKKLAAEIAGKENTDPAGKLLEGISGGRLKYRNSYDPTPVPIWIGGIRYDIPGNMLISYEGTPPDNRFAMTAAIVRMTIPDLQGKTKENEECFKKDPACPDLVSIVLEAGRPNSKLSDRFITAKKLEEKENIYKMKKYVSSSYHPSLRERHYQSLDDNDFYFYFFCWVDPANPDDFSSGICTGDTNVAEQTRVGLRTYRKNLMTWQEWLPQMRQKLASFQMENLNDR